MLYYIISYRIISYHITEFLKDNPPRALALLALPPPLSLRALRCGTDKISIALYYMIVIYIYIYIYITSYCARWGPSDCACFGVRS